MSGHQGRKPKPIIAIDVLGMEHFFETASAFMEEHSPYPDANVEPSPDMPNGWSAYSKQSIQRCCRNKEASYGGWRFRYAPKTDIRVRDVVEEEFAKRTKRAVPQSAKARLEAERQRQEDDVALMTGGLDQDQIKAIIRRKYGEIIGLLSKLRAGEWTPPKGWSAKEEVGHLREVAEVYGIDWANIADTRTEADKVLHAMSVIDKEGPQAAMELLDEELEAVEKAMLDAIQGCKMYVLEYRRENDQCPDHVKERFNSDGTWKDGVKFTEEDAIDADEALAKELAEFERESVYLDVEDEVTEKEGLLSEADNESGLSQEDDQTTDNGDDSGGAGVDEASGGASRPPAPESLEDPWI